MVLLQLAVDAARAGQRGGTAARRLGTKTNAPEDNENVSMMCTKSPPTKHHAVRTTEGHGSWEKEEELRRS